VSSRLEPVHHSLYHGFTCPFPALADSLASHFYDPFFFPPLILLPCYTALSSPALSCFSSSATRREVLFFGASFDFPSSSQSPPFVACFFVLDLLGLTQDPGDRPLRPPACLLSSAVWEPCRAWPVFLLGRFASRCPVKLFLPLLSGGGLFAVVRLYKLSSRVLFLYSLAPPQSPPYGSAFFQVPPTFGPAVPLMSVPRA